MGIHMNALVYVDVQESNHPLSRKSSILLWLAISSPLLIYSYHKFEIFSLRQVECRGGPKSLFFGVPNLGRNFSRIGIIAILFNFHYKFIIEL